jgi:hypothetical protein
MAWVLAAAVGMEARNGRRQGKLGAHHGANDFSDRLTACAKALARFDFSVADVAVVVAKGNMMLSLGAREIARKLACCKHSSTRTATPLTLASCRKEHPAVALLD